MVVVVWRVSEAAIGKHHRTVSWFAHLFYKQRVGVRIAVVAQHLDGHALILGQNSDIVHRDRRLVGAARQGDQHIVDDDPAAECAETDEVKVGIGDAAIG